MNTNINNINLRKETKEDYHATELMTMRAFWNLHGPGCNEHLLVNKLRGAEEYLPELSRVAELDGKIVGRILGLGVTGFTVRSSERSFIPRLKWWTVIRKMMC